MILKPTDLSNKYSDPFRCLQIYMILKQLAELPVELEVIWVLQIYMILKRS